MYPVVFNTIPDGMQCKIIESDYLTVKAVTVQHLIPTIGLRFDFSSGKSVAYSCDTEPCEQLVKLAENSDVLIQESAGPNKGHTSARQAGTIGTSSKAHKLILIHYDNRSGVDNLIREAKIEFDGEVLAALDGMDIL
jgi:ribonuclease BN (tRNA processing enzyme)